jgi:hypothetical protein
MVMLLVGILPHGTNGTIVPWYHGTDDAHVYSEGGSERVGVYGPSFATSLNWLPCVLPKHTWFSVHMCALSNQKVVT